MSLTCLKLFLKRKYGLYSKNWNLTLDFFFKFFEKLKENNLGALLAYATKNNIVTTLALFKNEKPTFFGENHQKNR